MHSQGGSSNQCCYHRCNVVLKMAGLKLEKSSLTFNIYHVQIQVNTRYSYPAKLGFWLQFERKVR